MLVKLNHNRYISIMMQIYFKSWLVKFHKHHADKDLLVKCHIIVMQIYRKCCLSVTFMIQIIF